MDIKRVAFETRPVKSARPAVAAQKVSQPVANEPARAGGKIDRQEIAAIVDRFLAGKRLEPSSSPLPSPAIEAEAGSMYAGPSSKAPETRAPASNGAERPAEPVSKPSPPATNGAKAVDFVSEDDVRRAIQKGEKIYINARTIITPAARDIGEPAEIFAKV